MNLKEMASNIGLEEDEFIELLEMLVDVSLTDIDNFESELNAGSYNKAAMAAHSIKGASGNLGLTDISSIAAELEKLAKNEDLSQITEKVEHLKNEFISIANALKL